MITICIVVGTMASQNDVKNVIDWSIFSAIVLEGVLVALAGLLRKVLLNHTEDPNKLTNDCLLYTSYMYSVILLYILPS